METKKPPYVVRPTTAVLTSGFDPRLSVGSARPAVFRSSTYVFSSPESAERAFAIALGLQEPEEGESVDLIYARLSHPNAEILEDQVVPAGTRRARRPPSSIPAWRPFQLCSSPSALQEVPLSTRRLCTAARITSSTISSPPWACTAYPCTPETPPA